MFYLKKREVNTALVGLAAAVTYAFGSRVAEKQPVRSAGLFVVASVALAGVVGAGATAKSSAKARVTEARLNNFFNNGGSVGGDLHVVGNHFVTGTHTVTGTATFQNNAVTQGNHTIQGTVFGSGGSLQIGDNLDTPSGALQVNPQLTVLSGSGVHTNGPFIGNTTGDSNVTATQLTNSWATQVENRINDFLATIG